MSIGKSTNVGQLGEIAIHREDPIGGDDDPPHPGTTCGSELGFEIAHVAIAVAIAPGLRQPDAVDDRSMVEAVGDNGIVLSEQRFEQTAIGVETGGVEDRILLAEIVGDLVLERTVEIACAADEPHGCHAEAVTIHRLLGGSDQRGMIGETKIVVGAEIEDFERPSIARHPDMALLRRDDRPFRLPQGLGADGVELGLDLGEDGHRSTPARPMSLKTPERKP